MLRPILYQMFMAVVVSLLIVGCNPSKVADSNSSNVKSDKPESKKPASKPKITNFQDAEIVINSVKVQDSTQMTGTKFPNINITYKKTADYVKILRCKKSYQMLTSTGDRVSSLDNNQAGLLAKNSAWVSAWGSYNNCKVATSYFISTKFVDYAAANGSFYYVINPCVSKGASGLSKSICSNRLSISINIEKYTNHLQEDFRTAQYSMQDTRSKIAAILQQIGQVAVLLQFAWAACENYIAVTNAKKSAESALINLAAFAGGALLGSEIPGLGGYMGGLLAEQAIGAFVLPALHLGPQTNTCMDGKLTDVEQVGMKIKAIPYYKKKAKDLEQNFGVHSLIVQLQAFSKQITTLMTTLAKDYTKLNTLDANSISLNKLLLSHGVKPGDPSTVKNLGKNKEQLDSLKNVLSAFE